MPPSPPPINTTYARTPNNTYFTSDQDEEEPGFTDFRALALACLIILLPLIIGLFSYFGIKLLNRITRRLARIQRFPRPNFMYLFGRLRGTNEPTGKTLDKESAERNKSSHALLNDQLKSSESQFSVIAVEDGDEKGANFAVGANQTSKSTANGSIITMTMKNNHLIVETEERVNSTEVVASENTGVFVVDVEPNISPLHDTIVNVPEESQAINTGLSQSDLSVSSHGSCYRDFTYGTQQEYVGEVDYTQRICHIVASDGTDVYIEPPPAEKTFDDEILEKTDEEDKAIVSEPEPEISTSQIQVDS